jgi:hypothetical protein
VVLGLDRVVAPVLGGLLRGLGPGLGVAGLGGFRFGVLAVIGGLGPFGGGGLLLRLGRLLLGLGGSRLACASATADFASPSAFSASVSLASAVSLSFLALSRCTFAASAAALACNSAFSAAFLRNSAFTCAACASARSAMVWLSPPEARVAASAVSPAFTIASSAAAAPWVTCAFCCPTSRPRPRGAPLVSAMV